MSDEPPSPPQVPADGGFYWDGTRWVPKAGPGQLPAPPAFYAPTPYIEPRPRRVPEAVVVTVGIVVVLLIAAVAGGLVVYVNHFRSGSAVANGLSPARLGAGLSPFATADPLRKWLT